MLVRVGVNFSINPRKQKKRIELCSLLQNEVTKRTMITKEITINGKTYPVVFNMKTIIGYERISGKSFFGEDFSKMGERLALIAAAVISAGGKEELSIDEMMNADTMELVQEILTAYMIIIGMVNEFFKKPDVEPNPKEEEGDKGKN